MSHIKEPEDLLTTLAGIQRGAIARVHLDGSCEVALNAGQVVRCALLLQPGMERGITPREGAPVLVWIDPVSAEGVILGEIGLGSKPEPVEDELVIEARKSLTLKVGDGSITIREDGRILIKGKDLVSHAKRMNRIRGGSVQIN